MKALTDQAEKEQIFTLKRREEHCNSIEFTGRPRDEGILKLKQHSQKISGICVGSFVDVNCCSVLRKLN